MDLTGEFHILLVEDDPLLQKAYHNFLTGVGYTVTLAYDGLDALEKLETGQPSIILCDVNMPRMDGFAFRQELKKTGKFDSIPFVFLTSRASEEDVLQGLELGADDYISKETTPRILVKKMQTILRRKALQQGMAEAELVTASLETDLQLTPEKLPTIVGYKLEQWHYACEGIPGGDFYDYIPMSDNRWLVVIGDVMGKKWKAWMFAHAYIAYVRSTVRGFVATDDSIEITPARLMASINRMLYLDEKMSEIFCSLGIVLIESNSRRVRYCNASHLPLLHYQASLQETKRIENSGIVVGMRQDIQYTDTEFESAKGDWLCLLTDGLIEVTAPSNEQFGIERFEEIFTETAQSGKTSAVVPILEEIKRFSKREHMTDDATIITFRCI
jgi:sigma-B regulation protein RsbU (phosphoserine phosphatase)